MTIYEQYAYLYGFDELNNKPVTLYYLPTKRCRKWRAAWSIKAYTEEAYNAALTLANMNNWFTFKFEGWS